MTSTKEDMRRRNAGTTERRLRQLKRSFEILHLLTEDPSQTRGEIAERLGVCDRTALRYLQAMEAVGVVERHKIDKHLVVWDTVNLAELFARGPKRDRGGGKTAECVKSLGAWDDYQAGDGGR